VSHVPVLMSIGQINIYSEDLSRLPGSGATNAKVDLWGCEAKNLIINFTIPNFYWMMKAQAGKGARK
jgi:hypothetical protein